jgi:tetratricopeptide (TPR) repeat protein
MSCPDPRLLLVARRRGRGKLLSTILWVALAHASLGCHLDVPALDRATLLAERGQTADAIELLEAHVREHPPALDERRLLIRLHGAMSNGAAASAHAERLAELMPASSPVPWLELGAACELSHRYDDALAAYDRAASVAPRDSSGPKRGGMRAARWGELELAEPRLSEAVRRDPSDGEAWHALGLVRTGLGQLDAARQAYTAGISADPDTLENRLGLATVALRLNEPAAALAQYDLLLEARPKFTAALLGKSWSQILMGDYGAAEATLAQAERLGADRGSIERQRVELRARAQPSLGPRAP